MSSWDERRESVGTIHDRRRTDKIQTLITLIPPEPEVRQVLTEIEDLADIHFLAEGESEDAYLPDVEVYYGTLCEESFVKAPRLRWVHTNSTGVDPMMYPAFQESDAILTNAGKSITTVVADHAVTMLFALMRNLHLQRDLMKSRTWRIITGRDIGATTLGIVGFGNIGSAIAERARPFVNRVHALDIRDGLEDPNVDRFFTLERFHGFLQTCDGIICSLPLTPATQNLFSDREFEVMGEHAYFVNIGRGGIVDEAALGRALRDGQIAGAGLDVFEQEPYPSDGPLWDEPKLLITPHSAGFCETLKVRKIKQFVENFRHFVKEGTVPGALDKARGW